LAYFDSDQAYAQIQQWLTECNQNHFECRKTGDALLPTRVVDVGSANHDPFVLVVKPGTTGQYATLSYCWGLSHAVKLTQQKLDSDNLSISLSELPATPRDAILICRKLGIPYLWIDALCIIQDSMSDNDWRQESGKMARIYGNSILTIAATAATNASDGIFAFPIRDVANSCRIPYRLSDSEIGTVNVEFYPDDIETHEPLNSRAWAFQESVLSHRSIRYQKRQLAWDCHSLRAYANGPEHARRTHSIKAAWEDIVTEYTKRNLTHSRDRLEALSGLAKMRYLSSTPRSESSIQTGNYLAGLWQNTLLTDLLWTRAGILPLERRPTPFRAPTWSWASINGPVRYRTRQQQNEFLDVFEILNINLAISSLNPFGSLQSSPPSYLKLKGLLKVAPELFFPFVGKGGTMFLFGQGFETDSLASFEDVSVVFDVGSSGETYSQNGKYLWSFQVSWIAALILYPVNGGRFENTDLVFERVGLAERAYSTTKWSWFKDVQESSVITIL